MKSRRVVVTLEIETDASLKDLKKRIMWEFHGFYNKCVAFRVQANLAKAKK